MSENASKPKPSYGEMREKLKPDDVDGKPAILTVAEVSLKDLAPKGQRSEFKVVLVFEEFLDKEYIVNATSYKTLCAKLDGEYDSWVGQRVVMAPTTTEYDGKAFEKLHVAIPERWDKVMKQADAAAKKPAGKR